MSYGYTTNLGNEIQSIAARRFLPKVDAYIDHEKIDRYDGGDVNMIINGWYLDCPTAWPPSDKINPLLVSMHFTTSTRPFERREAILKDESREFFSRHGPVGCRDMATVNFLKDNDIDAYFTGCLTLTLDSGSKKQQSDSDGGYVVVNMEQPDEVISFIKQKTDKKVYQINQDMMPSFKKAFPETMTRQIYNLTSFYTAQEKFFMAENLLRIYENAACVITDRLHCALPSLAFETPVLFFNERNMKERFEGLGELLFETTPDEYMSSYGIFDVDNPPENSKKYLKIRNDLIKMCSDFTGNVNDSCYSDITYNELLDKNSLLLSRNALATRNYFRDVLQYCKDLDSSKSDLLKFKTARLDFKCFGDDNDIELISQSDDRAIVKNPNWFKNKDGNGFVIESSKGVIDMELRCLKDSKFKMWVRSKHVKDKNNTTFPIYIDYSDITIDGEKLIDGNVLVMHDRPITFEKEIEGSQIISIHVEWSAFNSDSDYSQDLSKKVKELENRISHLEDENTQLKNQIKNQQGSASGKIKSIFRK